MAAYDMIPWKLVFCRDSDCNRSSVDGLTIYINDLPLAPEPGRIPAGVDHLHIETKHAADQRDVRGSLELWRTIALATARCEHGRMQQDRCLGCPGGWSPDKSGTRVGTYYDGSPVVIPDRLDAHNPKLWVPERFKG